MDPASAVEAVRTAKEARSAIGGWRVRRRESYRYVAEGAEWLAEMRRDMNATWPYRVRACRPNPPRPPDVPSAVPRYSEMLDVEEALHRAAVLRQDYCSCTDAEQFIGDEKREEWRKRTAICCVEFIRCVRQLGTWNPLTPWLSRPRLEVALFAVLRSLEVPDATP